MVRALNREGGEMRIRNLLVLAITILLGTLCAQAQERDGSRSFTDHLNQRITISRFGTVLSFRDGNGKETVPSNNYRVCLCSGNSRCIESANTRTEGTSVKLRVEFPTRGATLKKGQTLVVTATIRLKALTLKRRLVWVAGSSAVGIDEAVSASRALAVCSFEESGKGLVVYDKPCPAPPGGAGKRRKICPDWIETSGKIELSGQLRISPEKAHYGKFGFAFPKAP
jgi:hypothetical protein